MVRKRRRAAPSRWSVAARRVQKIRTGGGIIVRGLVQLVFGGGNYSRSGGPHDGEGIAGRGCAPEQGVGTRLGIATPLAVVHPIGKTNRRVPAHVIDWMISGARNGAILTTGRIGGIEADATTQDVRTHAAVI